MLSYAYKNLTQKNYEKIATEDFEYVHDLFAAILSKGIASQLKQGLYREYIGKNEDLPVLRGKIDMQGTIRQRLKNINRLSCEFDELSENNYMNQILKVTAMLLISCKDVKPENKASLKKCMLYFSVVDTMDPSLIKWDRIRYHRNNQTYRMLMNICYLVLSLRLASTEKGEVVFADFFDKKDMWRLYESFIFEYYKVTHKELSISRAQIPWNVDDDYTKFLPKMYTDITLSFHGRQMIIDAKYKGRTMQQQYLGQDTGSIHSGNLYQIFSYVKNKDVQHSGDISGALLYAKTDEEITPDNSYLMDGNKISVKTLDLNRDFSGIKKQLDDLIGEWLGNCYSGNG